MSASPALPPNSPPSDGPARTGRILLVEDDQDILVAARLLLKREGILVHTESQPDRIPRLLREESFDAVLLDMNFAIGANTGREGFLWLRHIHEADPTLSVVLMTAYGDIATAVEAMKSGASDFVQKPWANERLVATLRNAITLTRSRREAASLGARNRELAAPAPAPALVAAAPAMTRLFALVDRAAPTDANVLILGENGTGKEVMAREIHRRSRRADGPFVAVDLGAVAETLFESELFGHKKGAFTDAREDRAGRLVAAQGGTLFLDEIGNLPLHLQSKLLSVLEQRMVTPVGGNRPHPIDVRLVCATNMPVERLQDPAHFRQDLLYRINTVELRLPPLRERPDDIPALVAHFSAFYARKYALPDKPVAPATLDRLVRHPWPGNVRALRHAVERAMILSAGPVLTAEDFSLPSVLSSGGLTSGGLSSGGPTGAGPTGGGAADASPPPGGALTLGSLDLDAVEAQVVRHALEKHKGNVSHAAGELGITRASLYRRMEKHGL